MVTSRLKGRLSLLVLAFAVVMLVFPATALALEASTDSTSTSTSPAPPTPTIQSDQDDYPPGGTVILTGSNWQPGETVNINVNDDESQTWNRNVDVVADENGNVRDEFVLPAWFVAKYYVTATGSSGAVATTTFTDAVLPSRGCDGSPILVDTPVDEFSNNANASGPCSLREAISAANGDSTADSINLPAGLYALTRAGAGEDVNATGDLDILQPLTINGGGARVTTIHGGGIDRVLHATSSGSLTLRQTTVTGGLLNNAAGGGIRSDGGSMTLTDVTVANNSVTNGNDGGGIYSTRPLTINRATIVGNSAGSDASADGGGLYSTGETKTLTNVTITNNSATGSGSSNGGGGFRIDSGTTTFTNVTVSHNSAPTGSNILKTGGTLNLRNTIVSDGTGGGANCAGSGTLVNTANNLDSGTLCGFGSANSSKSNANANLGALLPNGGPTDTRALGPGSAAIDAGTSTSAPTEDQRTLPRPRDGDGNGTLVHDIGAFELQAPLNVPPVTTVPTFNPASPKTNDLLQASTTTSDANNNVSVAWVWKVTRSGNTCQVKTDTSAAAAPGERTSSLDLSQSYTTSSCTVASPPASINPSKGDTVVVEATPHDGTVSGTMRSNSVAIANSAPVANDDDYSVDEDNTLNANGGTNPNGVLFNDTDADGDSLTATPVDDVDNGELTLNSDGTFTYEPAANFDGEDSFTYKASDGPAESNIATVNIDVTPVNDAPVAQNGSVTTDEDTTSQSFTLSASDVENDPLTYTIVSGPTHGTLNGTGNSRTYTPAANYNGSDSFTFKANDGKVDSNTATVSITVNAVNDVPTVKTAAADDKGKNEGATLSTQAAFQDTADNDALTITKTAGEGAVVDNGDGTWSWSLQTDDNVSGSVTVTASDGNGGTVEDTFEYSTVNVDPQATFNAPEQVDEGSDINLSLTDPVDPGSADTFEYAFDCGDGNGYGQFGASDSASCSTNDDGTRTVKAKIKDDDGGESTYTAEVTINNVAPAVTTAADQSSDEGSSKDFELGSFTDPGDDSPWQVTVDWGDNSTPTIFAANAPGSLGSQAHTYADNGTYTVKVTVAEDGGAPSDSKSFQVAVANVAPTTTLSASNDTDVDEDANGSETYNFSVSDPGDDTWTSSTSCGANGIKLSETATSVTCRFPDGTKQSIVSVQSTDSDNDAGNTAQQTVNIANVKPTLSNLTLTGNTGTACSNNNVRLQFTFSDPAGSYDTYTGSIDWGDGSQDDSFSSSPVDRTYNYSPGSYTINVSVSDEDGGSDNKSSGASAVQLLYNVSNLLEPVNPAGTTMSVFKHGSTVPLKVRITDCNNQPVNGLVPRISFTKVNPSTPAIGVNEGLSTQPNDTNFLMRDTGNGYYIYNLSTKSLADGDATYKATITDSKETQTAPAAYGPKVTQNFGLRSK